jgi:hypothetical protein
VSSTFFLHPFAPSNRCTTAAWLRAYTSQQQRLQAQTIALIDSSFPTSHPIPHKPAAMATSTIVGLLALLALTWSPALVAADGYTNGRATFYGA